MVILQQLKSICLAGLPRDARRVCMCLDQAHESKRLQHLLCCKAPDWVCVSGEAQWNIRSRDAAPFRCSHQTHHARSRERLFEIMTRPAANMPRKKKGIISCNRTYGKQNIPDAPTCPDLGIFRSENTWAKSTIKTPFVSCIPSQPCPGPRTSLVPPQAGHPIPKAHPIGANPCFP